MYQVEQHFVPRSVSTELVSAPQEEEGTGEQCVDSSEMITTATVFIVDDDGGVRESLRRLTEAAGLKVLTFATVQAFMQHYDPATPGCLVLDVRMPGMSGLDLQERLATQEIRVPVIFISGHADVPIAVRALKAGAVDFLEKPFEQQQLLESITRAIALDSKIRKCQSQRALITGRMTRLTPRERQVMDLVVVGKPNKQIASNLRISQKTVEAHRASVMKKLQANSAAELVRIVLSGVPAE